MTSMFPCKALLTFTLLHFVLQGQACLFLFLSVAFFFANPKKAMAKNVQTTLQFPSSHTLVQ